MWLAKYFKVVVLGKLMEKMKLKTTLKIPCISHYEIFFSWSKYTNILFRGWDDSACIQLA